MRGNRGTETPEQDRLFPQESWSLIDVVTLIEKLYHAEKHGVKVGYPREYLGSRRLSILHSKGVHVGMGTMLAGIIPLLLSLLAHYGVVPVFGVGSPSSPILKGFDRVFIWIFPFAYTLSYGWIIYRASQLRAGKLSRTAVSSLISGYRLGVSIVAGVIIFSAGFLVAKIDPVEIGNLVVKFISRIGMESAIRGQTGKRILLLVTNIDTVLVRFMCIVIILWAVVFFSTYVHGIKHSHKKTPGNPGA